MRPRTRGSRDRAMRGELEEKRRVHHRENRGVAERTERLGDGADMGRSPSQSRLNSAAPLHGTRGGSLGDLARDRGMFEELGLIPEGFHLGTGDLRESSTLLAG